MKKLIENLIIEAKKALETPFDAVHDARHHKTVWSNCKWIIEKEKIKGSDMDALKIAAWWHDVQRSQVDETEILKKTFKKLKVDSFFQKKVLSIINSHSFGNKQSSLEEKILFDADKLEYVSEDRIRILVESFKKGEISNERFNYYVDKWRERILAVRDQLHFDSVRLEFENRLKNTIETATKDPYLKSFVEDIML